MHRNLAFPPLSCSCLSCVMRRVLSSFCSISSRACSKKSDRLSLRAGGYSHRCSHSVQYAFSFVGATRFRTPARPAQSSRPRWAIHQRAARVRPQPSGQCIIHLCFRQPAADHLLPKVASKSLSFKPTVAIHRNANSSYSQESRMAQHLAITLVQGVKNFNGNASRTQGKHPGLWIAPYRQRPGDREDSTNQQNQTLNPSSTST